MRQVYGINVKGAYVSDSFETAYKYPMREAYYDTELYAAEAFTEDGTMPVNCVCRYLANMDYLLWHRLSGTNRQYCMNPEGLFLTHEYIIAMHDFS